MTVTEADVGADNNTSERSFTKSLKTHDAVLRRLADTEQRRLQARQLIQGGNYFSDPGSSLFVAGSMGRGEMGARSDLDLFLLATKNFTEAEKTELLACMRKLNLELGYPPFSNARYVKVYDLGDLLKNTGSPQDDSENCFTARMLLLLESAPLANKETYQHVKDQVLSQYFRDERGKSSYRPLFLLNDVLRYWRTLCLNYEEVRHDPSRPWWKRNINLKFSRMLTVFATVAILTVRDVHSKTDFESVCDLSPQDRLALALDQLDDNRMLESYGRFLNDYEQFLSWKEDPETDERAETKEFQEEVQYVAGRFSDFLYGVLMHARIPSQRRKYLVI